MNNENKLLVNIKIMRRVAAGLAVLLCLLMSAGCSRLNGAEKKVSNELKALQEADYMGGEVLALRDSLSDEGKKSFDGFLNKLRSFDYEITGSEEEGDSGDARTLVKVKITAFGFGREYLAVWTEYLKENKDAKPEDMTGFYEMLFDRLNSLSEKECISNIEIVCIDPVGNGEWIANIKENEELQDAIYGGMLGEMESLAAE